MAASSIPRRSAKGRPPPPPHRGSFAAGYGRGRLPRVLLKEAGKRSPLPMGATAPGLRTAVSNHGDETELSELAMVQGYLMPREKVVHGTHSLVGLLQHAGAWHSPLRIFGSILIIGN